MREERREKKGRKKPYYAPRGVQCGSRKKTPKDV